MDRDTELIAYLLHYLHDNHYFRSIEEIAAVFDISKRQIQRLINDTESRKGGSIALSKILQYFGLHHIPFDPVLTEFIGATIRQSDMQEIRTEKPYLRLHLPLPEGLTDEGISAYEYCKEFVGLASAYICPSCRAWCNPWDGTDKLKNQHCFVAQLASALLQSIASTYSQRT